MSTQKVYKHVLISTVQIFKYSLVIDNLVRPSCNQTVGKWWDVQGVHSYLYHVNYMNLTNTVNWGT